MIVDANILLYAVAEDSAQHLPAKDWLEEELGGPHRVALPWSSLGAFLRLATNPAVLADPLDGKTAWHLVERWLATDGAWSPAPGARYAEILGDLITRHDVRGNVVPDALLAALAIEHGLGVCSADTDFARFPEVRWHNPCTPRARPR